MATVRDLSEKQPSQSTGDERAVEPASRRPNAVNTSNPLAPPRAARPASAWHRLHRALLARVLQRLNDGALTVRDAGVSASYGAPASDLVATLEVHDSSFYPAAVLGGSVGAGRSYFEGAWDCDDLTQLVCLLARNEKALDRLRRGPAAWIEPLRRTVHALRRNTVRGSRRNIEAHYDLSNAFFAEFLDPTMLYSCAYFVNPEMTLEQASRAKIDRICRKLQLGSEDHVLEIGTGWGGFAEHAAREYGCRVTTATISKAQHDYSVERLQAAGLAGRVEVVLDDYRHLRGRYDKLVSIEMIEAVGAEYLDTFFAKCSDLLKSQGSMLLQSIIIDDAHYERASRSVDFIKKYIFPGSCIPSIQRISRALTEVTDLRCADVDDITPHYAETLKRWRQRFMANRRRIQELGFSEEFVRMWEFYFCYCEGGFLERRIGNLQMLLTKPEYRGAMAEATSGGLRWTRGR